MRFLQACSTFLKVLSNKDFAEKVQHISLGNELPASKPAAEPKPALAKPAAPKRSEAITLLATLQREARLVDIVMEPLDGYTDAQVGAATRDVLRDCGKTLQRLFAIAPVAEGDEGAKHKTPVKVDSARYRLTGNVAGEPPYEGTLVHRGWQATRCELPTWSGSDDAALVIAPVEVELA